jgi:iron complex outermembrane recepter protein
MRLSAMVAAVSLSIIGLASADDVRASIKRPTNIPSQGLGPALQTLAKDRNFQVVYVSEEVNSLRTQGAVGEFTSEEALKQLLGGTGMTFRYLDEKTVTIVPVSAASLSDTSSAVSSSISDSRIVRADGGQEAEARQKSFWSRFRLAQADQGAPAGSPTVENKSEQASYKKPVQIEEVIVTATKREERLQDVPMSLAVVSSEDIERRGLIGMEDYLRSIPGVNQIDRGSLDNTIVIRGITTSPEFENTGSGTTVASYFDETPMTGAAGLGAGGIDVRPVDMERIEVLRGPQGTTFGDASLGGTIRMIPVKPKLDAFSAKLAADYSNTSGFGSDNSMIQGVVNIPVVADKFALRAVGYRYDESGFYRNIAGIDPATIAAATTFGLGNYVSGPVQGDVGRMLSTGGRLTALWQATDKLDLSLNFLTQKIEQDGLPFTTVGTIGTYQQVRYPIAPQGRVRGEAGEISDNKINLSNLVLRYDLGWAALTSAASWIDASAVQAIGAVAPSVLLGPYSSTGPADFKSFTAETRLASHLEGRFQFLGGLFYEHVKEGYTLHIDWPGTPANNPLASLGLPATNPLLILDSTLRLDQRAVFGEGSYNLTDKLTATVGGRYFKYDKNTSELDEGGFLGVPIGAGIAQNLESSEGHSTYKANLSYKPTKESLLYASWGQGFRLGHPSAGVPSAVCDPNNTGFIQGTNISVASTRNIDSDFLDSYEIGGKFTSFDRRVVVDTAVYHIKWNGLPTLIFPPGGSSCPFAYTANAGAATSDGVELQASLFAMEGLRFDFGAGYTKARLSKDAPGLAPDGARLPGSPKASANLAAQYDFHIAGHKAFARADSFYTGRFYGDLLQTPSLAAGDYIKIDARAGVEIKNLSVELFGRNLTNRDAFTWQDVYGGYRLRPRTVGVQLGYKF